jgi:hypothetical protein
MRTRTRSSTAAVEGGMEERKNKRHREELKMERLLRV